MILYYSVFFRLIHKSYFCSMESFNITLATSWAELTDKQLPMV